MILKNTSDRYTIVVNTVVGKVTILPNEIVDIKHKILPPLFSELKVVSEQEYLEYKKGTTKPNKVEDKKQPAEPVNNFTPVPDDNDAQDFVQKILSLAKANQLESVTDQAQTVETVTEDKKDSKSATKSKPTNKTNKALKAVKTESKTEIEKLEEQLSNLKSTWVKEINPKEKEKLGKEIKKVQKQIDKINKN